MASSRQPGAWGIDIGQSALKALRIENKDGVAVATAFDFVEHPKILSQPDADPDLLTRESLEKFLSRNSLRGDKVAISVSGQAGLARFVKLPPVEERKIGEIVKFEAKQQIPFPLEEVVWDYQKIGSGVVTDGFAMETEIGLFAIKRENVSRTLQHFQDVNIEVDIVQMSPLALCSFVGYDLLGKDANSNDEAKGKRECVVALDVGVDNASLVITDGSRTLFQRNIGLGGNAFTRALTKDLKLTYAKAEHLKKNATKSPDLKRILLALRPDLNKFVEEVQKSLQFFSSTHRDAQIKYMIGMGGAFRLPGLQKYLQEKLQLDVRKLTKFTRLQGDSVTTAPVFNDNVMSMGVVYGLALQGLSMARLRTNLLPQEIRMDRLVRSKKPWAVAAAACLLLGVGGLAFGTKLEHDAVADPLIVTAMDKDGKHALDEGSKHNKEFAAENEKVENDKKSILSIVAGQNERLNWIKLNQFIDECLPRPDGKDLGKLVAADKAKEEKQKAYWTGGGEAAWNQWMASQTAAKTDAPVAPTAGLTDLLQINLESVNALFTDDLAGYFGRLQTANKEMDSMPTDDKTKAPNGPGWVVELRGYTFHQGQRDFIVDTLLENLAAKGRQLGAAPKQGEPGDPIGGRVSHPLLYKYKWVENHQPGKFELIDNSDLFPLVQGGLPGKGGLGAGGAAGLMAAGKRDGWKPLGTFAGTLKPRDADQPAKPLEGATDKAKNAKSQPVRTEFIILFIWREPTWDVIVPTGSSGTGGGAATGGAGAGKAVAGKTGQGK